MPPASRRIPKLCHHKASGQGVVRLNGKDHYCGPFGSPEAQAEYDRLIAEWLASDRRPLCLQAGSASPGSPPDDGPTVEELIFAFWPHVERHYRHPDGSPTSEVENYRHALRPLRRLYGDTPAREFGPLKLKAVRRSMIDAGLTRTYINAQVGRVARLFKWAAAEELVPVAVYQSLKTVDGLRRGRTEAREPEPVGPVADETVNATLPFLTRQARAMVELQRLTGMRPGEVCRLRPCDVDRSGEVWVYRPARHKTQHKGKARVVAIGPKAQAVLRPFLDGRDQDGYCFVPREAVAEFRAGRRAARKTKVQPSQQDRKKRRPKRQPGACYTPEALARAVARARVAAALADLKKRRPELLTPVDAAAGRLKAARAVARKAKTTEAKEKAGEAVREAERAFHAALDEAVEAGGAVRHWHPNQLRHSHATEVRKRFGLEAAQVALGHARADVTQIYAERDLALALRVAGEVG